MFLRRYDITTLSTPHHQSQSCIVHLAIDHVTSKKVALKFMCLKENYHTEIESRSRVSFDDQYVVSIEATYNGTLDEEVEKQLYRFGLQAFTYIIVMPAGKLL